jgi:hypothetical protein
LAASARSSTAVGFYEITFASLLLGAGLLLALLYRSTSRVTAPERGRRERELMAYESRRMRLRRDRVWWRMESLYSEFAEREADLPAARAHELGGLGPEPALTPTEVRDAFESFVAARGRRAGGQRRVL